MQDIVFPRNFFAFFFPFEVRLQVMFLWNHPSTPQKSNIRPLKSTKHLLSWQILICQSFLKAFETNYQESLYERTYADVITKISWMDSLPNFLTHGAPLRGLCYDRPGESKVWSWNRTVINTDWSFDNLCGSHLQNQLTSSDTPRKTSETFETIRQL